jgi:hypothetical protein
VANNLIVRNHDVKAFASRPGIVRAAVAGKLILVFVGELLSNVFYQLLQLLLFFHNLVFVSHQLIFLRNGRVTNHSNFER